MRQHLLLAIPLTAALALASTPGQAHTASTTTGTTRAGQATHATHFALRGSGFGTKVVGGQVPAGSETTGHAVIGCTDVAGLDHSNDVAHVALPGVGTANGVRSRIWTTDRNRVTASHARHSVASVDLASSGLGSLSLAAVTSGARASHDSRGFRAATATSIGAITFTPPGGGAPQTFPAPTPDQPVDIPGLATIYAGQSRTSHTSTGAVADAYALRVDVTATGSSLRVAHSHAEIHGGLLTGVFGGHSAGTHVTTALDDTVTSGPNPLTVMPCQGTYGQVRRQALAHLDLGGQVVVRGATSSERAAQSAARAHGYERGGIAHLDLGGRLVVDGIVGKATVTRTADGLRRSARGTQVGTVTVDGQVRRFPSTGVLEIPGLVKLERHLVTRTSAGLRVVSLRVTLLDGSGGVVDLGTADLRIRPLSH